MSRRRADAPPSVLPFFLNAELQELGHLGTAALGAHWRLVYWVWSQGKAPDDNDDLLARIVRLRPVHWRGVRTELLTVWRVVDGCWLHDRLADTIAEANGKRRVNSGNGKAGGHAKALKNNGEHLANARRSPAVRQPEPSAQQDIFQGGGESACGSGEPDDLWELVKGRFAPHLRRSWLDNLSFVCIDLEGAAQFIAPSRFIADRVSQQLGDDIRKAFGAAGAVVKRVSVGVGSIDILDTRLLEEVTG